MADDKKIEKRIPAKKKEKKGQKRIFKWIFYISEEVKVEKKITLETFHEDGYDDDFYGGEDDRMYLESLTEIEREKRIDERRKKFRINKI